MAMFSPGSGATDGGAPATGVGKSGSREPGLSIVAPGMEITGELSTNGVIKVEGTVIGSVRAEGQVLIAKGGLVDGDVLTREAIIGGAVKGAVYADDRVEVQATSQIEGDITTQRLVIHEGGEVNGHVSMADPKALEREVRRGQPHPPLRKEAGAATKAHAPATV